MDYSCASMVEVLKIYHTANYKLDIKNSVIADNSIEAYKMTERYFRV